VVSATEVPAVASRAATSVPAFTGATIVSWSPWNTISGTRPADPGFPPVCIAANAETMSFAAPYAIPEWTPTPENSSG